MVNDRPRNVLVFNPGSGSLKFEVIAVEPPVPNLVRGKKLLSGVVEPIGSGATFSILSGREKIDSEKIKAHDHGAAAKEVLARIDAGLAAAHGITSTRDIVIVGHRIVHGGSRYVKPAPIDDALIRGIREFEELAPLHIAGAISIIRASRDALGEGPRHIAVFDTGFHR